MNTTHAGIDASGLSDETRAAGFWRRRGASAETQSRAHPAGKQLELMLDDAEPLLRYLINQALSSAMKRKAP